MEIVVVLFFVHSCFSGCFVCLLLLFWGFIFLFCFTLFKDFTYCCFLILHLLIILYFYLISVIFNYFTYSWLFVPSQVKFYHSNISQVFSWLFEHALSLVNKVSKGKHSKLTLPSKVTIPKALSQNVIFHIYSSVHNNKYP